MGFEIIENAFQICIVSQFCQEAKEKERKTE